MINHSYNETDKGLSMVLKLLSFINIPNSIGNFKRSLTPLFSLILSLLVTTSTYKGFRLLWDVINLFLVIALRPSEMLYSTCKGVEGVE